LFDVNGVSIAAPGYLWFAFAPSIDDSVRVVSVDPEFPGELNFHLDNVPKINEMRNHWGRYLTGAAHVVTSHHQTKRGLVGVVGSEIPRSAGLSSSAAVGLAYLEGLLISGGFTTECMDPAIRIAYSRGIENGYMGLNNGILDQGIISLGKAGKLVVINCRAYAMGQPDFYKVLDAPSNMPAFKIIYLDTGRRRDLTETDFYNEKVKLCWETAKDLCYHTGQSLVYDARQGLSQITPTDFLTHAARLSDEQRKVALHVYGAAERIRLGNKAWQKGDLGGHLITAAGYSLSKLFGVGSPELDYMTELALSVRGVLGARQAGAGIGGGVEAIILDNGEADKVIGELKEAVDGKYVERFGQYKGKANLIVCTPTDGMKVTHGI
jgi:galacturonokinase